jgi:GT2 family glycosyltransferase
MNTTFITKEKKTLLNSLSVIIVTWKGDEILKNCLDSLFLVYNDLLEIIVVDNAALNTTCDLVLSYKNVKYIPSPGNPGFAGGNNIGIKKATREYILLLNNDTVIYEDSFSPLVEFLNSNKKVGIVQGTMNIPSLNNGLDDCGVLMTPFGIQRHLNRGKPTKTTKLIPRKVFAAKGAMMMFKREVLNDLGFLFYDHFISYYEETDFCHRAYNAGWETWFVPTPPIDHICGATSCKFDTKIIWRQYIRNIIFSFCKNFSFFSLILRLPCFAAAAFIHSPVAFLGAIYDLKKIAKKK